MQNGMQYIWFAFFGVMQSVFSYAKTYVPCVQILASYEFYRNDIQENKSNKNKK